MNERKRKLIAQVEKQKLELRIKEMQQEVFSWRTIFYCAMVSFVLLGIFLEYNYETDIKSNYSIIQNSTIHNSTLMLQVTNEYNLAYLRSYNAIPIYVDSPFGRQIYRCVIAGNVTG